MANRSSELSDYDERIDAKKAFGTPSRAELLGMLSGLWRILVKQHLALQMLQSDDKPGFDRELQDIGDDLQALLPEIESLVRHDNNGD